MSPAEREHRLKLIRTMSRDDLIAEIARNLQRVTGEALRRCAPGLWYDADFYSHRAEYHREYYWRNVRRRREQKVRSMRSRKRRTTSELLRVWKR